MSYRRKSNRRRNRVKQFLILGVPILILAGGIYFSFHFLSQASESTFNPNKYKENASDDSKNPNNLDSNNLEGDDNLGSDEEKIITSHEHVVLDTEPNSITVLVNKELSLPSDYIPDDLVVPNVEFSIDYYDEKKLMRKEAAEALEKLFAAAKEEGLSLTGVSAYRSYERQYEIFTNNIKVKGLEHTTKYSAVPGYSEHQTGLSIDVSTKSVAYRIDASFAKTKESTWLKENAHLYGFIIRYGEDKTAITGYAYEPWHIRYVGKSLATYLYENNLCLEEYYNYTPSVDYTDSISYDNLGEFGIDINDVIEPTKAPKRVPTPSITPTPTPELSITPTPSITPSVTPKPTKKPSKAEPSVTKAPTNTPTPTEIVEENNEDEDVIDDETTITPPPVEEEVIVEGVSDSN